MVLGGSEQPGPQRPTGGRGGSLQHPRWQRLFGWAVYGLLPLAKLWLVHGQLLAAITTARIDDRLFLNLARNLLAGEWLGPYDQFTLIKGMFYSLWIAAVHLVGLPLLLAQQLFYLASLLLLVVALRPLVTAPWLRAVVFAVLLWNPMTFTNVQAMRVVREGIYPALGVLVTACAVALLGRAERSTKELMGWAAGLGLALGAFWLTREEGLWLLPLVLPVVALAAFRARRPASGSTRRWLRPAIVAGLPALLAIAACLAVAAANRAHYGVFVLTEIKSPSFTAAYGALTRVRGDDWHPLVPVSRQMRQQIYPLSPAMAELRSHLEGRVGQRWVNTSCRSWGSLLKGGEGEPCDEIAGGWFQWALREAVDAAGHHRSATAARDYYLRLAAEINGACDEGRLRCRRELASLRPRWDRRYLQPLFQALFAAARAQTRFRHFDVRQLESKGDAPSRRLFAEVTGELAASEAETRLTLLRGWVASPRGEVWLQALRHDGSVATQGIRFEDSPEADWAFRLAGIELPEAARPRFTLAHSCRRKCRLRVLVHGETLAEMPLADFGAPWSEQSIERPDLSFFLAASPAGQRPPADLRNARDRILNRIGLAYRALLPPLALLALLGWLRHSWTSLRRRELPAVWVLLTALLAAVVLRLALLAALQVSTVPAFTSRYLCPSHPQLLLFTVLAVAGLGSALWQAIAKRHRG